MKRVIVQSRFPSCAFVITTSASPAEALARLANLIVQNPETESVAALDHQLDRRASANSFQFRGQAVPSAKSLLPPVQGSIVASAGGSIVHVRVRDNTFWRAVHMLLLLTFVGGLALSSAWSEVLAAPCIAIIALVLSVGDMWLEVRDTAELLRGALPE